MKIKILALILFLNVYLIKASEPTVFNYGYTLGIGMSTSTLLGNGPNTNSMNPLVNTEAALGGSFKGAQPGIDIRFTYQYDENGKFRIPIGVDWTFYDAIDRFPIAKYLRDKYENSSSILAPYIGLNYHFLKLDRALATMYAGLEVRANLVSESSFRLLRTNDIDQSLGYDLVEHQKASTLRLGSAIKIGAEGELADNYLINISGAYSIVNLLLKDSNRGELLTPRKDFETSEKYLQSFNFLIMIQYKFGK